MLNNLINELKKEISKEVKYISIYHLEINIVYLFILKYLCDYENYNYEEVIKKEITIPNNLNPFRNGGYIIKSTKKLLPIIQYEDLPLLIKEYITKDESYEYIDLVTDKKLCITTDFSKKIYDTTGNTTYIIDKSDMVTEDINIFKFFDKVLNNNNQYLNLNEIDINKSKYLYIHDFMPRYRYIRNSDNDIYNLISKILNTNPEIEIILHTDFKKISNMNESWYLVKYIKNIILFDDVNTFIHFKNDNLDNSVSIINYDKIKSLPKLLNIIKNNRRQKDILIKTTKEEIKENRYRIGFKLYQNKIKTDNRNINEIVDENTRLIKKLTDLNKNIELEINKLMNR